MVLTQRRLRAALPERAGVHIVCLDADEEGIGCESNVPLPGLTIPQDVAYVIYTSGSTGRPKGVEVAHAEVVRLFRATERRFHFEAGDVWTLFHSFAFDFSVWEIWGSWLYGGRLVVVPYWVSRSPEAFYELLACERVTVLNQTPSAFQQLIWAERAVLARGGRVASGLRWVIFGGEALEISELAPWWDLHGDEVPRLVNMYGITETTVHVTFRFLSRADLRPGAGRVIGRPLNDLAVHLLDSVLTFYSRCLPARPARSSSAAPAWLAGI